MRRQVSWQLLCGLLSCSGFLALSVPVTGEEARPVSGLRVVEGPQGSLFETPVETGRLVLEALSLTESAALTPRSNSVGGQPRRAARSLQLSWELSGPPDLLQRLHDPEDFLARDDRGRIYRWRGRSAFWRPNNQEPLQVPPFVRFDMTFAGLEIQAKRLASLRGALLLHESASAIKIDLPFTSGGPSVIRTVAGREVTLEKMRDTGGLLELTLKYRAVDGSSLGRSEVDLLQQRVVDGKGNVSSRFGGIPQIRNGMVEINSVYLGRVQGPITIRVEGLVLSEKLVRVPVALRNVDFPRLDDPKAGRDRFRHSIEQPERPNSLSIQIRRGSKPAGPGILSLRFEPLDLAPRTGFSLGPLDVAPDAEGRVRLQGLRPGRYRLYREWLSEANLTAEALPAPLIEFSIPETGELRLPPLDLETLERTPPR